MKNLDRISEQIERIARELSPESPHSAKKLTYLALKIVDETDRKRVVRRPRSIKNIIRDNALLQSGR